MAQKEIDNVKGVLFNLLSMFLFVSLDSMVKQLVISLPVYEVIFFRCLTGIPVFIAIVHFTSGMSTLKIINKKFQFLRAGLGVFGMFFFFNSYKYLTMADAASILFSAPLMLTVLSVIFLKEKVGLHRGGAIIVGFIGVLFIAQPGGNGASVYMLLPLVGAFSWSLVIMTMRVLSRTDHANAVTLVFSLMGVLAGGVAVTYNGGLTGSLTIQKIAMLFIVGTVGIFAQLFMMKAVEYAEASMFASTKYISLVFTVASGYIFFGEIPVFYSIIGMMLIILSGLYNVYREYRLNKIRKTKVIRY